MFNVKLLALFLVLAAAPSLAAQDKDKVCNDLQQKPMRVGQWASYRWTGGRTDGATMRMAVVGTEAVGGAPYYWLEVVFDDAKGNTGKTVLQMLVPGLGNLAADVRGMILKTGAEPAMRMPEEMVRMTRGQMDKNFATEFGRKCMEMEVVGWEQTTVAGGSFRALHLKHAVDQTDAWVVPDLYFGLLRAKLKDGSTMELSARGADAKSSITETPQTMPFPR